MRQLIYRMLLQPLTKFIKKITRNRDGGDDHFNHPYVIF